MIIKDHENLNEEVELLFHTGEIDGATYIQVSTMLKSVWAENEAREGRYTEWAKTPGLTAEQIGEMRRLWHINWRATLFKCRTLVEKLDLAMVA
ncbi:MAG: hypothetical protein JWN89_104 [Parcubacteria group bacterium]|nr:hypothetical protein [Parcubacteria group bacterium]